MTVADIKLYVGEDVDVAGALTVLQEDYEHRGIVLLKTGNRWHFQTAHDLSHLLRRERQELRKLSRAGNGNTRDHWLSRTCKSRRNRSNPGRSGCERHA